VKGHYRRNPRDKDGNRVPRHGTIARVIYDLHVMGFKTRYITRILTEAGIKPNSVRVELWKMRNWQRANSRAAALAKIRWARRALDTHAEV
jgi:hypothetical protein